MNWLAFSLGMAAAGFWMIGWGSLINNDGSVFFGIIAWIASLFSLLASLGVSLNPLERGRQIAGVVKGVAGARAPKPVRISKKGLRKGIFNLKLFDAHGKRIKRAMFSPGDRVTFDITLVPENDLFTKENSFFELIDHTNMLILDAINVPKQWFSSNRECVIQYEVPEAYKKGSKKGSQIQGTVCVDVRIDFETTRL